MEEASKRNIFDDEFLEKYIPSSDVKKWIRESSHVFSDWDRATIVWNSLLPLMNKWEDLQIIADETADAKLREQILERLDYDREAYHVFKAKTEVFVYSISSACFELLDKESSYYGNSEAAYKEGSRCCGMHGFSVEKHQVISSENTEIIKVRAIYSPLLEGDDERQMEEFDTGGICIARCDYSEAGELMSLWSCELPKEQDLKVNALGKGRFENRYVAFPNPFEKHDRVRILESGKRNGMLAWVGETQNDWREKNNRACSEHGTEDYWDASLMVKYWNKRKYEWEHDHINPILLEKDNKEICNSSSDQTPGGASAKVETGG